MTRYELSKPVKTLLEYGLLRPGVTFFDYGCGQGADLNGLRSLGYAAEGWDPVYRAESIPTPADVVNCGYVINVIEDPAERLEALCKAYALTEKGLVVSAMIQQSDPDPTASRFRDGILTKRNTFQKFFEQQELQQFIEDALERSALFGQTVPR
jgi:DNA phosphorothioation-associated putative methyltransferase